MFLFDEFKPGLANLQEQRARAELNRLIDGPISSQQRVPLSSVFPRRVILTLGGNRSVEDGVGQDDSGVSPAIKAGDQDRNVAMV